MASISKIIVGMSGGVDSSVSALLLKEAGYQVQGLFMKNWEDDDTDTHCSASVDMADAQSVCDQLQIELLRVNFAEEYWQRVFTHFLAEYRAGRTPNPDILCNKEIKFKAFLDYAKQHGAEKIAMGHYARTQIKNNQTQLLTGLDPNKDQSYFLYALTQEQLSQSLFPIGHLSKQTVREIAKKYGFKNHAKKDSTGICFIGERKFKNFLNNYLPAQPGAIHTVDGIPVGKHDGLMFYTLGQRQGLKIGGQKNRAEAAWYVVGKNLAKNILLVAQGNEDPALYCNKLNTQTIHWINSPPAHFPLRVSAKTRYRQIAQTCIIDKIAMNRFEIIFDKQQRAITPGQSVVFYQDEICLGGGIIE